MNLTCPRCQKPMPPLVGGSDAQAQSVLEDMAAGRLINAIKTVREASGRGLREAKDYVDCTHAPLGAPVVNPMPAPPPIVRSPMPAKPLVPFSGKIKGRYELRQLPEEIRKKLVDLSTGWTDAGHAALRTEGMGGKILAVIFGLGLVGAGVGFFNFYHFMPTPDLVPKCLPLVFAGTLLVLNGLFGALRIARCTMKPSIVVNPAVLVRTSGGDVVEIFRLQAVTAVRPLGGFTSELRFGDEAVRVSGGTIAEYNAVIAAATAFTRAVAAPSPSLLEEHDWLRRMEDEKEVSARGSGSVLRFAMAVPLAVAILLGSWAAKYVFEEKSRYNDVFRPASTRYDPGAYFYFAETAEATVPSFILPLAPLVAHKPEVEARQDDVRWTEKSDQKNPARVREYMKEFPKGRHMEDAKKLLHELYADAEAKYVARAKHAESSAKEGMKALLAHLREKDDPGVGILFQPVEGLAGAGPEAYVKKLTGSSKVAPVGPAFTKERNETREGQISVAMKTALREIFSDDLFLFEGKDKPGVRFVVRHKVLGSGDYYTNKKQEGLALAERDVYVGIVVQFEVTLEVGDERFPVKIVATPAPNFSVRSASSVYDVMAQTAFDEFGKKLVVAYGID